MTNKQIRLIVVTILFALEKIAETIYRCKHNFSDQYFPIQEMEQAREDFMKEFDKESA